MKSTAALYENYKSRMQRLADIKSANAILQWDQETYMPSRGAHFRGQQISTLAEIAHAYFSEEELGNLLNELNRATDLDEDAKRNVELTLEDYVKNKKYTPELVRSLSEQTNKTFHAWIEARKQNSFKVYEKELDALIALKKREAETLGYEHHPYNALLNEYEKGATVEMIDRLFHDLLPSLKKILDAIAACPQVDDSFLKQKFPRDEQWQWGLQLIPQLGYDMDAGRQDVSEHPFSISFSPHDVRITTRIDENDFGNMTWSCIHEVGHALYEQGLLPENYGLPLGEACSYSIHESQSRLWENNVGRGLPFWEHYYPQLQAFFPGQLGKVGLDQFYKAINRVEPSLIRTEADEISYHFHVYIRYALEKDLLSGNMKTADIPSFWNEQYKKWLGVEVPDDRRGCLQDVHWSHGSFGYFPTYSLGSFYAAQFYGAAKSRITDLEKQISGGKTTELLSFLRGNVHRFGRKFTSDQLCLNVSAQSLNIHYFIKLISDKYSTIYPINLNG